MKKKNSFGWKYIKGGAYDRSKVTIVDLPFRGGAGRVVNSLLRYLKEDKDCRALVVRGAKDLTLAGNPLEIIKRYKVRSSGGNLWRSGPKYPRLPASFLRRMIRGMLDYKGSGKVTYSKFVIDPVLPVEGTKKEIPMKLLYLHKSITLKDLTDNL